MLLGLWVLVSFDRGLREQGQATCRGVNGASGDCAADQGCTLKAPVHVQGWNGTRVPHKRPERTNSGCPQVLEKCGGISETGVHTTTHWLRLWQSLGICPSVRLRCVGSILSHIGGQNMINLHCCGCSPGLTRVTH